jgi:hypothetical protein
MGVNLPFIAVPQKAVAKEVLRLQAYVVSVMVSYGGQIPVINNFKTRMVSYSGRDNILYSC